uniref:F-type SALMFamide neuropeptide n=1 Tax=Ophionotus victoriae TaxID=667017 RepID=A0A0B5JB10_9ECHI|nr:F-type SALMFamide neuropeptide precursor [Ophionotus victoriae]
MARVRNIFILLAAICCHATLSHAEDEDTEELNHEQLVEFANKIMGQMKLLEYELGIQEHNDGQLDMVKSLSKRQAVRPGGGAPMNVPVKMSGFSFGKRDAQLVRRSAGATPSKLAGFAFGKRGQPVKRSSDNEAEEEQEKRGAMDAFAFGKRPSGDPMSAFSFGKRRNPMNSLSALAFGKRAGMDPNSLNAFSFGKRRDPLSAFSFGKRGMDSLSAFNFGKRGRDHLSAFSFGKRGRNPMNGLSAFDFGKRGGMDAFAFGKREQEYNEEGAFDDEAEKRGYENGLSGYAFGKRDTTDDQLNHNDDTLRTD